MASRLLKSLAALRAPRPYLQVPSQRCMHVHTRALPWLSLRAKYNTALFQHHRIQPTTQCVSARLQSTQPTGTSSTNPEHPNNSNSAESEEDSDAGSGLSLYERLKLLIKKQGLPALIIYLALSCVDLSLSIGAIYLIGAEYVVRFENYLFTLIGWTNDSGEAGPLKVALRDAYYALFTFVTKKPSDEVQAEIDARAAAKNIKEAKRVDSGKQSSFMTIFVIAYGIHKIVLLPVRAGLTLALTPKTAPYIRYYLSPVVDAWRGSSIYRAWKRLRGKPLD